MFGREELVLSIRYYFVCKLVIIIHSPSIKASIINGICVILLQSIMLTINVFAITSILGLSFTPLFILRKMIRRRNSLRPELPSQHQIGISFAQVNNIIFLVMVLFVSQF